LLLLFVSAPPSQDRFDVVNVLFAMLGVSM